MPDGDTLPIYKDFFIDGDHFFITFYGFKVIAKLIIDFSEAII
jgi:hypothetical protein